MEVKGVVDKISSKEVRGGKLIYSFTLVNDRNYYRTSFTAPPFEKGDEVKFAYNEDKYGLQVDMRTVESRKATNKVHQNAPAASGGGGANSRDNYWAEKDRYDKEVRQPLISYQAATNVAKDLAIAALNAGILPTAGKAKADKFESFMLIVDEITNDIYSKYYGAVTRLEDGKGILAVPESDDAAYQEDFDSSTEEPQPAADNGDEW